VNYRLSATTSIYPATLLRKYNNYNHFTALIAEYDDIVLYTVRRSVLYGYYALNGYYYNVDDEVYIRNTNYVDFSAFMARNVSIFLRIFELVILQSA